VAGASGVAVVFMGRNCTGWVGREA
jgi:hypothetical protein